MRNAASNALNSSDLVLADVSDRILQAEEKISRLPATEQKLLGIQRNYEISGAQFQLLLEKRAEAGILQASNLPTPKSSIRRLIADKTHWAKWTLNLLIGLVLGLAIPIVVILLADALNTKSNLLVM